MIFKRNKIRLTESEGQIIERKNFIEYDEKTYLLKNINEEYKSSKGGNSSVFILYDPSDDEEEKVIKISNYARPNRRTSKFNNKRYSRFIQEIEALKKAKKAHSENVVDIYFDGVKKIDNLEFPYYVMEKGTTDLTDFMLTKSDYLDNTERVKLMVDVYNSIKQLHSIGIYHRDIKPDNIFLFNLNEEENITWKIGDLGLVKQRDRDNDDIGERIGPFGWISPEAMNKYLTEKANIGHDCTIDDKSDIFQLGKLFWFILMLNVPIGQICIDDFSISIKNKQTLYDIIYGMLTQSKTNRIGLDNLDVWINEIKKDFIL